MSNEINAVRFYVPPRISIIDDPYLIAPTPHKSNLVPHRLARAHQIGSYEITEPSLPISFTCTKRPRSSYQMSCE